MKKKENYSKIYLFVSLDKYFTTYVNQKTTVFIEDYDNTNLPIANFMVIALAEYLKMHKKFPDGVIIYRQEISSGQKNYLKTEIEQLQKYLMVSLKKKL